MSLTTTVTPYADTTSISSAAADALGAAITGTVAVAQWLSEETAADRAAVEQLRGSQRRERLTQATPGRLAASSSAPAALTATRLHLRSPESLVRSAERLGYHVEPLSRPSDKTARQPEILLRGRSGERLAIAQDREGGLTVRTGGDARRIEGLVRQHTLDRAVEHLRSRGLQVQTATLASGETQILAREQDGTRRGGKADVKAQVRTDGTVHVDVDCIRGSRCENIAGDLAEAIGGRIAQTARKTEYYQLPGEPTKTHRRV